MLKLPLIGLLLIFLFTATAGAQIRMQQKPRARKAAPVNMVTPAAVDSPTKKHFYLTALYSSANAIQYKGTAELFGVPTAFTATESSSGALGLAGGYMSRESGRFGYNAELAYELPRTSGGISGRLGNQNVHGTYDESPSNSVLTLAANGNYSFNSKFYIFAGINYPFASGGSKSLNGLPGYQLGSGYNFSPDFSSDLSYRTLRLKGAIDSPGLNLKIDEATFSGLILALHYHF